MADPKLANVRFTDAGGAPLEIGAIGESTIRRSVLRILDENDLCSMATVTGPGEPHVNTAHFCYSTGLVVYFLSHPGARHCRNLTHSPSVALTVFSSAQRWGRPGRGVQLFGTCGPARGADLREAHRLYAKRFPAYRRWKAGAGKGDAGAQYRFYRVRVGSVKLMDERAIGDGVFTTMTVARRGR